MGAVVLVALVLRGGWVLYRWQSQGPELTYDDERLHWQLATNLVQHGVLITDDGRYAARMPLYPLFLALWAGLGEGGILAARLAQAVIGAVTAGLAAWIAYQTGAPRTARLPARPNVPADACHQSLHGSARLLAGVPAGVLAACDPFGVFFANLLLSEVFFTLLLVALVGAAWHVGNEWLERHIDDRHRDARPGWRAAGGGVGILAATGAAVVLTRPSAALLVPAVWLMLAVWAPSWRQAARLLICPLVAGLALLPWGVRNWIVLDSFAWLSTNGGVTLYDAQGPQADGSSNQEFLRADSAWRELDEVTRNQTLARRAVAQMRADPARVLRLAGAKVWRTWSLTPNVAEYSSGPEAWAGAAYMVVLLAMAAVGTWRGVRAGGGTRRLCTLLWLPVVYFTLVHAVYVGSLRYRLPLHPLLALAAAVAIEPARRTSGRDWSSAKPRPVSRFGRDTDRAIR